MKLKPRRLPKKSKRIRKDQTRQLPNQRRIVLNEQKNELEVDQNIISYRELDTTTRRIFITAIKQCIFTGCINQIFTYSRNPRLKPQSITIFDSDANHMIWKMLRFLSMEQCHHKITDFTRKMQQKEREISQYAQMKSRLYNNRSKLQKKQSELLEDNKRQQMNGLIQKIKTQIKTIQLEYQKAIAKQSTLKEKISLYKASIQIDNKKNSILSYCLQKSIRHMIREFICQSIIGIVQIPLQQNNKCLPICQQVYVIFEQCYPTARIKFKDIIRIIGTKRYLKKCLKISKCISKPEQSRDSVIESLTMCHICQEIFPTSELIFCENIVSQRQTNPYCSFDIQLYRQNVIESDYFSQLKTPATMPYFLYNKDQNGQFCCNRAFCKKCLKNSYDPQTPFICPFCCGDCNCRRCEDGVKLVKLLAQDLEFDPQMQKNHHNVLNIFHQKPSKYCGSGRLCLRTKRDRSEFYLLFPFLTKRIAAHTSINYNKKDNSGQNKVRHVRWSRHLQERFSNYTSPGGLLQSNQQDSSVDSRFRDPRYKYFEDWRSI